jgi:hypothetical protein
MPRIPFTDSAHARLLRAAELRGLKHVKLEPGRYAVSSFSRKNKWHAVELSADGYECSCEATGACSHASLAASYEFPTTWGRRWDDQLRDEFCAMRQALYRGELSAQKRAAIKRRAARAGYVFFTPPVERESVSPF